MDKWSKEEIREKLETSDNWLAHAIVAIYKKQTQDEQVSKATNRHNNVGFTGCDAYILSSFAEQINAGKTLSFKQINCARPKMLKYARQLANIANGKI